MIDINSTNSVNSSAVSEEKPQRRKSTLSCGRRRSKSLGGVNLSADFYLSIALDKPKEDRLMRLFRMSFLHTLTLVSREFLGSSGFDMNSVNASVLEHYDDLESAMKKDGLFKLAVRDPPSVQHEEDIAIEQYIENTKRLRQESEEWDNIVKAEAANQKKSIDAPIETLIQNNIPDEAFDDVNCYDYGDLLHSTNDMLDNFTFMANHMSANSEAQSSLLRTNYKYLKHIDVAASKYLVKDMPETPRTLLHSLQPLR